MKRSIDTPPIRTPDNKPPRSQAIRKGTMKEEEIKKLAQELEPVKIVEAPDPECERKPIDPVYTPGNYLAYASALKAMIEENETVTVSKQSLIDIFPQNKQVRKIVHNLKDTYGINYRYSDANGGEYVFFDGETKDEKIERLEKEMEDLIDQKNTLVTENYLTNRENTQLKSDLYNSDCQRILLILLAILLFIFIIITNVKGILPMYNS